jgi:hypothetical protein|tara:strand:+ start:551 stop:943 length:393 start_codon:yes stop_codon:yes gene_type:complete
MNVKLNWKGETIKALSRYRTFYDKGIAVLAILRNMELSDLGIMMAASKYLFGDHIETSTIVILGVAYWVFNVCVNLTVGYFWEKNDGWRIEAQVFGKRCQPGRTVLVSPEGEPYGPKEMRGGEGEGHGSN